MSTCFFPLFHRYVGARTKPGINDTCTTISFPLKSHCCLIAEKEYQTWGCNIPNHCTARAAVAICPGTSLLSFSWSFCDSRQNCTCHWLQISLSKRAGIGTLLIPVKRQSANSTSIATDYLGLNPTEPLACCGASGKLQNLSGRQVS